MPCSRRLRAYPGVGSWMTRMSGLCSRTSSSRSVGWAPPKAMFAERILSRSLPTGASSALPKARGRTVTAITTSAAAESRAAAQFRSAAAIPATIRAAIPA